MKCKDSVTVILLSSLLVFTYEDSKKCDYNVLVGEPVLFPLTKSYDDKTDIRWKIKDFVIKKKVKTPPPCCELTKNGSLIVKQTKLDSAGTYAVEVYDNTGKNVLQESKELCVFEKVPKPALNATCKDGELTLTCEFDKNKDLNIIWLRDGKEIQGWSSARKRIPVDGARYQCTVRNPVHNFSSDEITSDCAINSGGKLFGFDQWIMVTILACGGGLLLLLMMVLIMCACQSCKRRAKLRDEEEYRLEYLNAPPGWDEQRSKQTARGQPAPPVPLDETNGSVTEVAPNLPQNQAKTKGQGRGRPPPPPIDEDEEIPPLPQPRKKACAQNCEAPTYMQ